MTRNVSTIKMRLVKGGPGMEVLKIIEDPVDLFIIINGDTITLGL